MVAGQMMDLVGETNSLSLDQITRLQNLKTGEMFAFSAVAGAVLSRASSTEEDNLRKYAERFGLAFQIADDLLDLEGDATEVGKPTGQDENANKATFVSVLGADQARKKAEILIEEAVIMLDKWGEEAGALKDLARYILKRTN